MSGPGSRVTGSGGASAISSRLRSAQTRCAVQIAAYGACVQKSMPDVTKGACQKEAEALKTCVFAAAKK